MMSLAFFLHVLPPDQAAPKSADPLCDRDSAQEALLILSEHDWTGDPRADLLLMTSSDMTWPLQGSTPLPDLRAAEFTLLLSGGTLGSPLARSLSISGARLKGADA
ncbi:MAG: hypothetical protein R6V62_10820 [Candidatus Fermentibacteraceae bacterium]